MPQLPRGTAGTAPLRVGAISVRAFKSFGGAAPSVFTFGSKDMMTCILGPNGCGKSALLEALCFALGAPASTMRVRLLREVVSTESDSQVRMSALHAAGSQHECLYVTLINSHLLNGTWVKVAGVACAMLETVHML